MNLARRFTFFFFFIFFAHTISGCVHIIKPIQKRIKLAIQLHKKDREVFSTRHWFIELKKDQTYIGSCTIRLKRAEGKLGYLTDEEWGELKGVIQALEFAAMHAFGGDPANWYFEMSCLMNHAYQNLIVIALVHIHFHPRTSEEITIFDFKIPKDAGYGYHYKLYTNLEVPEHIQKEIIYRMQEQLVRFAKLQKFIITLPDGTTHS